MTKENIKAIIIEAEPNSLLGLPDHTVDILITKILNSEKITYDLDSGLKNDYEPILSNLANIVTIIAFIYSFIEKKSNNIITINIVIEKFPKIGKSKKMIELIEKVIEIINRK